MVVIVVFLKVVLEVVLEDMEGLLKEVKDGLLEEVVVMEEMDVDFMDVVDIMDENNYVLKYNWGIYFV